MTQFCLFLSVVLGIYAGYTSVQAQPGTNTLYYLVGDAYFLIILLADIILTALAIGREFSDHTIRNKIIIGYTKSQVFLSELLTILVITIITKESNDRATMSLALVHRHNRIEQY